MKYHDIGCAKLDIERKHRNGFHEVIFCRNKSYEQIVQIVSHLKKIKHNILGTHVNETFGRKLSRKFRGLTFNKEARTIKMMFDTHNKLRGKVAVLCAGTADLSVAMEASETLSFFGARAEIISDVGVAGVHRLIAFQEKIKSFDVVIVAAGMEGALPSVVGGLIDKPIIAVPTSVGYGTNFFGVTPLFAMLNSCAEGISVVNIDNGFGAACCALRILRRDIK